jgi:hypothetical protein
VGTQRSKAGFRQGLVLDAGALIAFERAESRVAGFIEEALKLGEEIAVPASALAQAWRGGPRSARLARLIVATESDPLDGPRAKETGERLGDRDRADIADAHVVCCALDNRAVVLTSDPDDMKALVGAGESLVVVAV